MKKEHMPSISVSNAMGERIAAAADHHGCTMHEIVRAACADILEMPLIEVSEETFARLEVEAALRECTVLDVFHDALAPILEPEPPR